MYNVIINRQLSKLTQPLSIIRAAEKCCKPKEKKRGLILGAFEGPSITLTTTAEEFDTKCNGNLLKQLSVASGGTIKENSSFVFYFPEQFQRVVVVSLPKKFKNPCIENRNQFKESIREAAGRGCSVLKTEEINDIYIESFNCAEASAEGAFLANYRFQEFKQKKKPAVCINFYQSDDCVATDWFDGRIKANAQNLARRLMDTPSNVLTPTEFANCTQKLFSDFKITVNVHDEAWAKSKKMNAFLSVGKGSDEKCKFLEIRYGDVDVDPPIVLVGKGVTFDSGGISLKPPGNMMRMKADMGGAAVIVSALWAICSLKIEGSIVALIPLTENMPSEKSTKPGDVVIAANGKSICIDNTDAEGRLILADALSYSKKFNPACIVDCATLTGAVRISLGDGACGVFSNSDKLFRVLAKAAFETGDRVWRMPLWHVYTNKINNYSHVDVNNVGSDFYGGACTAAAFLREFVPKNVDWMHIDMAGVYGPGGNTSYLKCAHMTGRPTRTLIQFLINYIEELKKKKAESIAEC